MLRNLLLLLHDPLDLEQADADVLGFGGRGRFDRLDLTLDKGDPGFGVSQVEAFLRPGQFVSLEIKPVVFIVEDTVYLEIKEDT